MTILSENNLLIYSVMNEVKYVKWPVRIDHIEVRETVYTKGESQIEGKTFLFFVNPDFDFGFDRPSIMTVFNNSSLAEKYKELPTTVIDGAKVITAKTILEAKAPGETEKKPYIGVDGTEFESYGEYLITLGTKNALTPKLKTPAVVFADMPLSNGIEQFVRMKGINPQRRSKTGATIVSATTNVAAMVMYLGEQVGWMGKFGNDEACLKAEVSNQLSSGLWRKIDETILNQSNIPAEEAPAEEASGAE